MAIPTEFIDKKVAEYLNKEIFVDELDFWYMQPIGAKPPYRWSIADQNRLVGIKAGVEKTPRRGICDNTKSVYLEVFNFSRANDSERVAFTVGCKDRENGEEIEVWDFVNQNFEECVEILPKIQIKLKEIERKLKTGPLRGVFAGKDLGIV